MREVYVKKKVINSLFSQASEGNKQNYHKILSGAVELKKMLKEMQDILYSEFKGNSRSEFEEWKKERSLNCHLVSYAYHNLTYRNDT